MFSQRKTEVSYGNTILRNFDVLFGMLRKNKTEVSYGNTIPRNFVVWYVEENFKPMNCNAAPMWRFLCVKQLKNVQVLEAERKKIGVD